MEVPRWAKIVGAAVAIGTAGIAGSIVADKIAPAIMSFDSGQGQDEERNTRIKEVNKLRKLLGTQRFNFAVELKIRKYLDELENADQGMFDRLVHKGESPNGGDVVAIDYVLDDGSNITKISLTTDPRDDSTVYQRMDIETSIPDPKSVSKLKTIATSTLRNAVIRSSDRDNQSITEYSASSGPEREEKPGSFSLRVFVPKGEQTVMFHQDVVESTIPTPPARGTLE